MIKRIFKYPWRTANDKTQTTDPESAPLALHCSYIERTIIANIDASLMSRRGGNMAACNRALCLLGRPAYNRYLLWLLIIDFRKQPFGAPGFTSTLRCRANPGVARNLTDILSSLLRIGLFRRQKLTNPIRNPNSQWLRYTRARSTR